MPFLSHAEHVELYKQRLEALKKPWPMPGPTASQDGAVPPAQDQGPLAPASESTSAEQRTCESTAWSERKYWITIGKLLSYATDTAISDWAIDYDYGRIRFRAGEGITALETSIPFESIVNDTDECVNILDDLTTGAALDDIAAKLEDTAELNTVVQADLEKEMASDILLAKVRAFRALDTPMPRGEDVPKPAALKGHERQLGVHIEPNQRADGTIGDTGRFL